MCIYDMERNAGLEPVTFGLGSRRSTNWANSAIKSRPVQTVVKTDEEESCSATFFPIIHQNNVKGLSKPILTMDYRADHAVRTETFHKGNVLFAKKASSPTK